MGLYVLSQWRNGETSTKYFCLNILILDLNQFVSAYVLCFCLVGVKLFYVVIAIYLYGDLAIYAAAVPKSLTLVTWYVCI